MNRKLRDDTARLYGLAATLIAAAVVILPLAARSSGGPSAGVRIAIPASVPTVAPANRVAHDEMPMRDPFALPADSEEASPILVLRAYAEGSRHVAIVDVDGASFALYAGVAAFGSHVVTVARTGVTLADGRHLVLRSRER